MARNRTLGQMRTEALALADFELSTIVSSGTVDRRINQSIADLWEKLTIADPQQYMTTVTLTTVANVSTVAVSLFMLLGVDVQRNGEFEPARELDFAKRTDFDRTTGFHSGWSHGDVYYLHRGEVLHFFPTPASIHTIRVWHVPASVVINATSESFDGVNGWEDWVMFDVAIWLRIKEESDTQALMAERARVGQRIKTAARKRDRGYPNRPRDVRRRHRHHRHHGFDR